MKRLDWEEFRHNYGAGDKCGAVIINGCWRWQALGYPWYKWLRDRPTTDNFAILEIADGIVIYFSDPSDATWFRLKWL